MHSPINSSLPTSLASSADQFLMGGGRAGMPDIKVDNNGRVFITSGDGDSKEVVFERFSNTGTHEVSNKTLLHINLPETFSQGFYTITFNNNKSSKTERFILVR